MMKETVEREGEEEGREGEREGEREGWREERKRREGERGRGGRNKKRETIIIQYVTHIV